MTSTLTIAGGRVHSSPERSARADLHVVGERIGTDGGAAESASRIDAGGASVVPLLVDTVFDDPEPPPPNAFDLLPGHPATFAVIKGTVTATQITRMLVVQPRDLIAVFVDGALVARDGSPARPAGTDDLDPDDARLGAWTDAGRDMTQFLTRDGRYTETRNGRRDAYTGRFWLDHDRITYLDDTGFWAFGQYHRGVLHHAGYVLRT